MIKDMRDKVKQCPLCGNDVEFYKIGNEYHKKTCFEIKCKKCNLNLKQCKLNSRYVITEEQLEQCVLDRWNKRSR